MIGFAAYSHLVTAFLIPVYQSCDHPISMEVYNQAWRPYS
jgi:hypothetical protein